MTPHRIKRVTLALTTHDAAGARAWSDRCSHLFAARITPLLDRLCSEADDSPHLRRIDRLELDLGRLDPDDDETFMKRLTDALRPALARALADRPHDPSAAPLALLTLFARTGNLPWSADRTADPVAAALTTLLSAAPHALLTLLRDLADDPPALARLARHAPPPVLAALLERTFPEHAARLAPVRRALESTDDPSPSTEPTEQSPLPLELRRAVLTTLTRGDVGPETFTPLLALLAHSSASPDSPHFTSSRPPAADPTRELRESPHSPPDLDSTDSITTPSSVTIPHRAPAATPHHDQPAAAPDARVPRRITTRPPRDAAPDRSPPLTTRSAPAEVFAHLWRRARDTKKIQRRTTAATPTPPSHPLTATPPRDALTATPPREALTAIPPRDALTAAPPRDALTATPARDALTATPARDALNTTPPRDALTAAPARDLLPATPARDALPTSPARDALPATPARDAPSSLPAAPTRDAPPRITAPARAPRSPISPADHAQLITRRARHNLLAAEGELQLEDGGLVLLWPFLARMFERLALIDEHRRFPDDAAHQQAIALIAHLATGDPDPPEYQRTLAKLLCAHDLAEPCMRDTPIPPEHQTEAEHLLHAVIDHVPALHALDIPTFRGAFLIRPAVLGTRDGTWTLQVERQPHDVILDTFPWSWMWIKLPWMPDPLRVEW